VIFKAVGDQRPYPDHGKVTPRDWSDVVAAVRAELAGRRA